MNINFSDYINRAEEHRQLKDMSDLIEFNVYDNFEDFKHDVHVIYDGKYDRTLKRNKNFYHIVIEDKKIKIEDDSNEV